MSFKSGSAKSPAEQWKERAEDLAETVLSLTAERDELQGRLDEIADIAAPDRAQDAERLDRIERMVVDLVTHFGLTTPTEPTPISGPEDAA